MIVKSKLYADLRETFTSLRRHKVMLNPKKYLFGVEYGKFLGFLIYQREMEAFPKKVQAVIDMKSPRTIMEVQKLIGCLAAFKKCLPQPVR